MREKDDKNDIKMDYYANKIYDLEKLMKDESKFVQWTVHELNARTEVLTTNYAKHGQKCMAKIAEKSMSDDNTKQFHDEVRKIDELYIALKAQLQMRIDVLKEKQMDAPLPELNAQQTSDEQKNESRVETQIPMHNIKPFRKLHDSIHTGMPT